MASATTPHEKARSASSRGFSSTASLNSIRDESSRVSVPPPPIDGIVFNQRTQVPLAKDKVRHVGEPLAVVLAESRYIAEDALAASSAAIESVPA